MAIKRHFHFLTLKAKDFHLANGKENVHTCDYVLDVKVGLVLFLMAQEFLAT